MFQQKAFVFSCHYAGIPSVAGTDICLVSTHDFSELSQCHNVPVAESREWFELDPESSPGIMSLAHGACETCLEARAAGSHGIFCREGGGSTHACL